LVQKFVIDYYLPGFIILFYCTITAQILHVFSFSKSSLAPFWWIVSENSQCPVIVRARKILPQISLGCADQVFKSRISRDPSWRHFVQPENFLFNQRMRPRLGCVLPSFSCSMASWCFDCVLYSRFYTCRDPT
jgi:hypothetical protein